MIMKFSIENTFSIKNKQTINFELPENFDLPKDCSLPRELFYIKTPDNKLIQKLICIYGANAAGKTNMLYAFYFYLNFIINSFSDLKPSENTHLVPFYFTDNADTTPSKFEMTFYAPIPNGKTIIKYDYSISMNKQMVLTESLFYSPKGQTKRIFERNTIDKSFKWGTDVTGAKKVIENLTRNNCSLIASGAQANHPILQNVYNYLNERLRGIINPNNNAISNYIYKKIEEDQTFKYTMISLLNAFDISSISDIKIESEDYPEELLNLLQHRNHGTSVDTTSTPKIRTASLIHNINNKKYPLSMGLQSRGTERLMELTQPLIDLTKSSVLLMDEIESSLHPSVLYNFLKLFLNISTNSQLLFTTHNQELLDSDLILDNEIFFCTKTKIGNSVYQSISNIKGIRKGVSRKYLYDNGMLNGLPTIDFDSLITIFKNLNKI